MSAPSPIPKLLRESSDLTITSTSHISPSNTSVSFIRSHRRSCNPFTRSQPRLHLTQQPLFRNSLLAGVGFLELANAADFAANVWNQIPVPRYAMILMAIGGPVALLITLVAARDLYLSYQNVQLLRQERQHLHHLVAASPSAHTTLILKSRLSVNFRELGTELVDRILMDALMGFGALLVGTGTLMAIWGANHRVYHASNLLSGYIGNGLAAAFGVVNSIWSGYLVLRFQRHYHACMSSHSTPTTTTTPNPLDIHNDYDLDISLFKDPLRLRFRGLQWHAVVNGINGIVAGAASLVTATMWYGYVVLIPCIISLIACNWFWRVRLGYDRPLLTSPIPPTTTTTTTNHPYEPTDPNSDLEETNLLTDLATTTHIHRTLTSPYPILPRTILNPASLQSTLTFITRNGMFENFCVWVNETLPGGVEDVLNIPPTTAPSNPHPHPDPLPNPNTTTNTNTNTPPPPSQTEPSEPDPEKDEPPQEENNMVVLTPTTFLTHAKPDPLLTTMNEYLNRFAKRAIAYRERWLLEVVGCAVYESHLSSKSSLSGDEGGREGS
ncbi:uncharacterized protein BO80DRAFT_422793 [Aspergillus ibericus CBS 121593]|uniref:Integral membrane protein n=1 Tax=Aspergillus ibericus CBS 121593 TaxID=1448316 RepID=A0A395H7J2_9EURO|nr:hypothetical protein BO80DRAFT_422793 [Aspergillus ibericus CBS 121593]RAL03882.1 hypothetical protein BO80DRAFT_422793 [Aspergillus ibericus CBS 121593]